MVAPRVDALPPALAPLIAERRWVVWRWVTDPETGKLTKPPFQASDPTKFARNNDPADWSDYGTARDVVLAGRADGIGYCLKEDRVAAFDLDDSLDEAGNPLPWASQLIRDSGSYAERSISGTGLRVLGFGEGGPVHRKDKIAGTGSSLEIYRRATRYVVVTGDALPGFDAELRPIDGVIDGWVVHLDADRKARAAATLSPSGPRVERPGDGSDLPVKLFDLIRTGLPRGQRSEGFFKVVASLKGLGYQADQIEDLLTLHPGGIAEKFDGRLAREVERAFAKADPPRDGGEWFDQTAVLPGPLRLVNPTLFQDKPIPPRRWLVRDWAPWGSVTGLYGEGGLGKTLIAQQLQTAAAVGRSWLGLETAPVRSIGFYCEDSEEELWRRQADIDRHYGVEFRDLDAARWLPRHGDENLLLAFSKSGKPELTVLHRQLIEAAKEHRAELVIVDTVSDTFGGNENDRGQVKQFVSWCLGSIAIAIGGSVLCLAHPSRAGIASGSGDSGSTGWNGAFRSRLSLQMPAVEKGEQPDRDARELMRKKANYAAREDAVALRWRAGALVPAGVDRSPQRPCDEVFLDLLDLLTDGGRPVSDNSRAGNFAPRIFAQQPGREAYRAEDFGRAMQRLFVAGSIRMETYGRVSDLRQRIVRDVTAASQVAA